MKLLLKFLNGDLLTVTYDKGRYNNKTVIEDLVCHTFPDIYRGTLIFSPPLSDELSDGDVISVVTDPSYLIQYIDRLPDDTYKDQTYQNFVFYLVNSLEYENPKNCDEISGGFDFSYNPSTKQFGMAMTNDQKTYGKYDEYQWYETLAECIQAGAKENHVYVNDSILQGSQEIFDEQAWTNDESDIDFL